MAHENEEMLNKCKAMEKALISIVDRYFVPDEYEGEERVKHIMAHVDYEICNASD